MAKRNLAQKNSARYVNPAVENDECPEGKLAKPSVSFASSVCLQMSADTRTFPSGTALSKPKPPMAY